jgi:hypothetical protein
MPRMPTVDAMANPSEVLLRPQEGRGPRSLELFVRLQEDVSHFHAQGITLGEFMDLFAAELAGLDILVFRMPSELLNGNYWEPFTKEGESGVREKLTGLIARDDGSGPRLWRADRIPRGRLLKDGLEASVELIQGYVFRTDAAGLRALAAAWNGRERFDWVGVQGLPPGDLSPETVSKIHSGLSQNRLAQYGTRFQYCAQGDSLTRVLFAERTHLYRAIGALVRGFLIGALGVHIGRLNHKVCDQLARICDGLGFSATARDIIDKGRSLDIRFHLGRTPWGADPKPEREVLLAGERILLYYDVLAGLWGVSG